MSSLRSIGLVVAVVGFALVTFLPGVVTRAVDRVDTALSGATAVTVLLPLKRIQEVWPTDRALVLVGPERRPDEIRGATLLVALDSASGRCGAFDVRTAAMLPGDCAS